MDQKSFALEILRIINESGFSALLAGGCVRDHLLHKLPHDYDIATDANPKQVMAIFSQKEIYPGIKALPTGLDYGTVTLVSDSQHVEVTSLRQDVKHYGRRAKVLFGGSFKEDAFRRDFTINALYQDAFGHIYDFTGGYKDLQRKTLKFIGNGQQRIQEDFLRILRFFRFWAQTGFSVQNNDLQAIEREIEGLTQVSAERISQELMKILANPHSAMVIPAMINTGIFHHIWPQFKTLKDPISLNTSLYQALGAISPQNVRALARLSLLYCKNSPQVLLKGISVSQINTLARTLKMSNANKKIVTFFLSCFAVLAKLNSQADFFEFFHYAEQQLGSPEFLPSVLLPLLGAIADSDQTHNLCEEKYFISIRDKCRKIIEEKLIDKKQNFCLFPIKGSEIAQEVIRHKLKVSITANLDKELKKSFWNEEWLSHDEGIRFLREKIEVLKKN